MFLWDDITNHLVYLLTKFICVKLDIHFVSYFWKHISLPKKIENLTLTPIQENLNNNMRPSRSKPMECLSNCEPLLCSSNIMQGFLLILNNFVIFCVRPSTKNYIWKIFNILDQKFVQNEVWPTKLKSLFK